MKWFGGLLLLALVVFIDRSFAKPKRHQMTPQVLLDWWAEINGDQGGWPVHDGGRG